MKRRPNIITTSLLILLLACAAQIFAHGGFDHVTGTVVKLENNVLTVKTAKGDSTVKLDAKTEITRDNHPAQATDLKAGVRVVVDIPEGNAAKVAHSIKLGATKAGTAPVADAHAHDTHK
jgi:hypothetical protein